MRNWYSHWYHEIRHRLTSISEDLHVLSDKTKVKHFLQVHQANMQTEDSNRRKSAFSKEIDWKEYHTFGKGPLHQQNINTKNNNHQNVTTDTSLKLKVSTFSTAIVCHRISICKDQQISGFIRFLLQKRTDSLHHAGSLQVRAKLWNPKVKIPEFNKKKKPPFSNLAINYQKTEIQFVTKLRPE